MHEHSCRRFPFGHFRLYWAGDASLRKDDAKAAYIFLKRTVLEYPETEWARRARGLMLQNGKAFKDLD